MAAYFAKRNTKFGGGESEGGAGIHFPHTPFSSRPARAVSFGSAARNAAISQEFRSKKVRAELYNSTRKEKSNPRGAERAARI